MAISVPQMQQRFTGYDFGQNTARNLLDAVRMKNQNEMQMRQMELQKDLLSARLTSAEDMQEKQIDATDKLTSKQLRTRYNIAKMGDNTSRDLAADSNQLARDLQSGKLDWQTLNREDKQMFEKLAQQRGFTNAESMLRTELDAQAERQDKDISFRDKQLNFQKEIERGQLALSRNRLGFNKEMGRNNLGLGFARLDQNESQFGRSLDQKDKQFGMSFGENQRQFNIGNEYRAAGEKRFADDFAMKIATIKAQNQLARDKQKEIEEKEIFQKEINRGIEDTNLLQKAIDFLPFTKSTETRVNEQVYNRGGEPFKAYPPSYYYKQEPNAMLNSNSLLNLQNNPLFMSNQRALGMQYLQQPPNF